MMNKSQKYGLKTKADQLSQILTMDETQFPMEQKIASILGICSDLYTYQLEDKPDITGAVKQYLDADKKKIDEILQISQKLQSIYKERMDLATKFSDGLQQVIKQLEQDNDFFTKTNEAPIGPPVETPQEPSKPVEGVSKQVDKTISDKKP